MPEVERLTLGMLGIGCPLTRAGIASLAQQFIAEAKYPGEFEPDNFFEQWRGLIQSDIAEFWIIRDETELPIAALGALFVKDLFTGVMTGSELFWFVSKSARNGGRIGMQLFNTFEKRCDERGCKMRVMAHISGLNDDPLARLYARRGYATAEHFFRKVLV